MVTKAKAAAKPAAKQETPAEEGVAFEVGNSVKFLGYDADTPEADQVLTEGEVYEIVNFTEPDGDDPGGDPVLAIANPDYNPKKKEDPNTNPKTLEVQVFAEEVELVEGEAEEAEEAAPAPVAKKAAKAAKAEAAPAPAPAKGKKGTPAKAAAPAKGKKAKPAKVAKPPKEEEVDPLDVDLEAEDESVIALVNESEDLIQTAQRLEGEAATTEWQLGGLLYHIRKEKPYLQLEGAEEYKESKGFEAFLKDYFNIEYRKAMYLIKIYVAFTKAGITNAAEAVARMGWTKAKTIAPAMLEGERNAEELVELADTNTVEDLAIAVKTQSTVGGKAGTRVKMVTLKFRYAEDEGAGINAILETAKEQLGLKHIGEALAHIVNEWSSANGGKQATRAAAPTQKVAAKAAAPAAPAAKKAAPRRVAAAAH